MAKKSRKRPASEVEEASLEKLAAAGGGASPSETETPSTKKNEIRFGQHMASSNKRVRDRTVSALREWLFHRSKGGAFTDLDLLKIWRGLWYCMFMCDKAPVQTELAQNLTSMMDIFKEKMEGARFFRSFCITMQRDWERIDNLGIDKYYTLVRLFVRKAVSFCRVRRRRHSSASPQVQAAPQVQAKKKKKSQPPATGTASAGRLADRDTAANCDDEEARDGWEWDLGLLRAMVAVVEEEILTVRMAPLGLRLHVADVWVEEACTAGGEDMPTEAFLVVLAPWLRVAATPSTNSVALKRTYERVFQELLAYFPQDGEENEEGKRVLREWLFHRSTGGALTDVDLWKICRGLWYCMFVCDKAPVQTELAQNLTSLMDIFKEEKMEGVRFFRSFCITMQRDWERIDNLGIDKYYTLVRLFVRKAVSFCRVRRRRHSSAAPQVQAGDSQKKHTKKKKKSQPPATGTASAGRLADRDTAANCDDEEARDGWEWDLGLLRAMVAVVEEEILTVRVAPIGLRLHIADVWVEEACTAGGEDMPTEAFLVVLAPWLRVAAAPSTNSVVFNRTYERVFQELLAYFPEGDEENEEGKRVFKKVDLVRVQACLFEVAAAPQTREKRLYKLHRKYQKVTGAAPDANALPSGILLSPPKETLDPEEDGCEFVEASARPRAVRGPEPPVAGWAAAGIAAGDIAASGEEGVGTARTKKGGKLGKKSGEEDRAEPSSGNDNGWKGPLWGVVDRKGGKEEGKNGVHVYSTEVGTDDAPVSSEKTKSKKGKIVSKSPHAGTPEKSLDGRKRDRDGKAVHPAVRSGEEAAALLVALLSSASDEGEASMGTPTQQVTIRVSETRSLRIRFRQVKHYGWVFGPNYGMVDLYLNQSKLADGSLTLVPQIGTPKVRNLQLGNSKVNVLGQRPITRVAICPYHGEGYGDPPQKESILAGYENVCDRSRFTGSAINPSVQTTSRRELLQPPHCGVDPFVLAWTSGRRTATATALRRRPLRACMDERQKNCYSNRIAASTLLK